MSNIAVKWTGHHSQMFVGRDTFGHVVLSGSWPGEGDWTEWKALKPSDMLLISLASCSGYDVVMIMERQHQKLTNLYITVDGEQNDKPPYAFTNIHLHYTVEGENLDESKVARAIQLSEEQYCSVAATIRGVAKLSHSFEIVDDLSQIQNEGDAD